MISTEFGTLIASRIRAEHETLAARWFERLLDLLPVDARDVFPSNSLLDHVPALIVEISACVRDGDEGSIAANTTILDKARELGALRHGQRASLHQVLREYQILGGVLVQFVLEEIDGMSALPAAPAGVVVVSRIHHAVDVLSQATVEAFVTLYTKTISDQNERLEQFTRMAAHEWRQPLGALQFGVTVLREAAVGEQAARTLGIIERNVTHLVELTRKLESVARLQGSGRDSVVTQTVSASQVAHEAARQLREMAERRAVEIRIADLLPDLTVDVGRLELALVNLLSNAIKYSDPAKTGRFVDISGAANAEGWCVIEVRDNGIGIPKAAVGAIFQRFTRAHAERDGSLNVDGVGLGLSIVDDCVRAMGGRISVQSVEGQGTVFAISILATPSAQNQ